LSTNFADSLLQSFQEVSSRLRTLSRPSAADGARKGFDFTQSVGFSLAAADDVAKGMMVRTIGGRKPPCGPARTPAARFVDDIGATLIVL
jgi:hypothetical protein